MSDLFSYRAEVLKQRGMTMAAEAQERDTPGFSEAAYSAISAIAKAQSTVHIDDVLRASPIRPRHYNAWGSVWAKAIKRGLIRRSGSLRRCTADPAKHGHSYPVYDSLVFGRDKSGVSA